MLQVRVNISAFVVTCLLGSGFSLVAVSSALAVDIDAGSKIVAVQVFPSGAEITRVAKTKLVAGNHTIILGDLPAQAVPGSIRVEGKATGELRIGSVDSRRLFVAREDALRIAGERQVLEDQIQSLKDQRDVLHGRIGAAQAQRTLITNLANLPNRPPVAPGPNASVGQGEDWPNLMAFIGSSMGEISQAILESKVKIREIAREIGELEKKLSQLVPRRKERTEVKVHVRAKTPMDADLVVRYQIPRASWTPYYDARLTTGTKTTPPKLELTRRAGISQHSGENWDDVSITLSTTRPKAGSAPPVLQPLTVDFKPKYRPPPAPAPMAEALEGKATSLADAEHDRGEFHERARRPARKKIKVVAQSARVATTPFQAVFAVPGKVSVASTGEAKRVQVSVDVIEPALSVRAAPRLQAKAYLVATLKVPKGAPLMAGSVSLIRDGTFVGTGNIPLLAGEEEHDLGFGVDDLVRVRHDVVSDNKGETGLISSSHTETRVYRISLKNLHERAIAFTVHDQIPSSRNEKISVERTGSSAPTKKNIDNKRGVLAWEGILKPDQEHVINFGYRVTWPGGREIRYGG